LGTNQWINQENTQALRVWNLASGEIETTLIGDLERPSDVRSLRYTPDSKYLISGGWDSSVRIWDAATNQLLQTLKAPGLVSSVAVRPDSAMVAVSTGKIVSIWVLRR